MADYYVATTGLDSNPGTIGSPFLTILKGLSVLAAGDSLIIRGGTYTSQRIFEVDFGATGTALNPITVRAFTAETVIIESTGTNGLRFQDSSIQYVTIQDIIMDGTFDPAIYGTSLATTGQTSLNLTFIRCTFRNSQGNGFLAEGDSHYWEDCNFDTNGFLNGAGGDPGSNGFYGGLLTNCLVLGGRAFNNCAFGYRIFASGIQSAVSNTINRTESFQNGQGKGLSGASTGGTSGGGGYVLADNNQVLMNSRAYDNYWGYNSAFGGSTPNAVALYNNTFSENDFGVWFFQGTATYINNISTGNGSLDLQNDIAGGLTESDNLTGVAVDFVNQAAFDFDLLVTATNAIETGADLTSSGVVIDFNGLSRPQGTAFCIGSSEFPAVPVPPPTGPSNGNTAAGTTITFAHTAEANKAIYLQVGTNRGNINPGDTVITATYNGVEVFQSKMAWGGTDGFFSSAFVLSLVNPTPGTANIVVTCSHSVDMSAIAFNAGGGGVNGDIILAGGFNQDLASFTRNAYAWGINGKVIAFQWTGLGTGGVSITGGTVITTGSGTACNYQDTNDDLVAFTANRTGASRNVLITYIIPDGGISLTGGGFQVTFGDRIDMSSFGVTGFTTAGLPFCSNNASLGRLGNLIPFPGTVRSFAVKTSVAPGVGDEITVELMRGGGSATAPGIGVSHLIPTGHQVVIADAATSGKLDGIDLSFYAYERLSIQCTNTGATSLPAVFFITVTFLLESGETNTQVYGGGSQGLGAGGIDTQFDRSIIHPINLGWGITPDSQKNLVGIDGTITELIVNYQSDVSADPDSQYYIQIERWNGVSWDAPEIQDGTGGTVDTTATLEINTTGAAVARSRFSLTIAPGDFISVAGFSRTGSSFLRQAATIKFVPNVAGDILIAGHTATTGTVDIVALFDSTRDNFTSTLASEDQYLLIIPPLTAMGGPLRTNGEIAALETAGPGTGRSLIFKIRQNLADAGIDLTLSDSEIFDSVGGLLDWVEDDLLSMLIDAVNSPVLTRQFWAIPGQALAPGVGTIIVVKDAGGDTSEIFTFNATGGLTPSGFTLVGGEQRVFNDVPIGSGYGFSETPPPGWVQSGVVVSNGDPINNISVGDGETVTVTFTDAAVVPADNASGLYEMIGGKTDDTIWVDVSLGLEIDVKIP